MDSCLLFQSGQSFFAQNKDREITYHSTFLPAEYHHAVDRFVARIYLDFRYMGFMAWDRIICSESLEYLDEKEGSNIRQDGDLFINCIDLCLCFTGLGMVSEPISAGSNDHFPKIIGVGVINNEK